MRLLLWLTLVCLCAIGGDHVLALLAATVLIGCANDHLAARRGALLRRFTRSR
ncbi:hypothetical protein [Lentzea sp. NPDC004782]|uniref:hypothetical protein n=1 Tax=Lentzea sp. NPDC004782 TaxID=3154458 RepID=UPI0033B6B59B